MWGRERSWNWLAGWVCFIGGGWVAPSLAGPPFTTNDPDPPEIGQWELVLPATLKRDGQVSGELVTLDVNYGYRQRAAWLRHRSRDRPIAAAVPKALG